MFRWVVALLLILNLALFLWGWSQDSPLDLPLPPLAQAPGKILLGSEWSGRSDTVTARPEAALPPSASSPGPLVGPLPLIPAEGVDPGPAADGPQPDPPVKIPPVRKDEPGTTHTQSR